MFVRQVLDSCKTPVDITAGRVRFQQMIQEQFKNVFEVVLLSKDGIGQKLKCCMLTAAVTLCPLEAEFLGLKLQFTNDVRCLCDHFFCVDNAVVKPKARAVIHPKVPVVGSKSATTSYQGQDRPLCVRPNRLALRVLQSFHRPGVNLLLYYIVF